MSLERRTSRGGRDSVDHAPGSHDDLANACAGALSLLSVDTRYTGFLVYLEQLVRQQREVDEVDPASFVAMRPPFAVGVATGFEGRRYLPGDDGVWLIHPDDVKPFRLGGWTEVSMERLAS
jgi:hypothetical protein